MKDKDLIAGRNPVIEALKSGRQIEKILMQKGSDGSALKIEAMARDKRIPIQYVDKAAIDRVLKEGTVHNHQGVVAYVAAYDYCDVDDILQNAASRGEKPFVIILDGVEDPHNLGAIIRSADGAGAHGIIIPKRRAVGITDTVVKASAGAVEYVMVAKVSNLAQTIDKLKEKGLWIAASHMEGEVYYKADLNMPLALVIGGEGDGVSKLILKKADFTLAIPMKGKINSLNASNAAAVLLNEISKQRKE